MPACRFSDESQPQLGLLDDFRGAINRLRVGEFTLILREDTVIRIERLGEVCVYCEIPIARPCPEMAVG